MMIWLELSPAVEERDGNVLSQFMQDYQVPFKSQCSLEAWSRCLHPFHLSYHEWK